MATGLQNRHSTLIQDSIKNGLQSFVSTTATRTATTTSGTPAAGTFYSSIVNRAPIVDIAADLRPSFGIERVMTQQVLAVPTEFGPNGEQVWSTPNDTNGLIRFVGNWKSLNNSDGLGSQCAAPGDFIEIAFYGTGLNLLAYNYPGYGATVSIDGGTAGSNIYSGGNTSIVLQGRNYSVNTVVPAVSGLTLGFHTAKILVTALNPEIYGFEILNANSTTSLNINPGTAYIDGLKTTLSSALSPTYNTAFESGALGTRGGHVVAYLKSDGTIGKAVTPVSATSLFLTAADHTNEEPVRPYFPREFGAGRTDDFSQLAASPSSRAFTLDDGTTTLIVQNGVFTGSNPEALAAGNSGDFVAFIFVGTGLDILVGSAGATATSTITVDGTAISTATLNFATANVTVKIASGLPYGTHTVKITNTTSAGSPRLAKFIVYQPKKPSLPAGAIELCDYNVMANFVANSTAGLDTVSTGTLRKSNSREWTYVGTGFATGLSISNTVGGTIIDSSSTSDSASYTFFGTGFDFRFLALTDTGNTIVTIDGLIPNTTNFVGSSTAVYGGTVSYNPANGVLTESAAAGVPGCGFIVTGLSLGLHTVKFAHNSGTTMRINTLDIITPIHSVKSNTTIDLQNTLTVGSNALSDNRQTTPIKKTDARKKASVSVVGITSGGTSTSTSPVPIPDMSATISVPVAGELRIFYSVFASLSTSNVITVQAYLNGSPVGPAFGYGYGAGLVGEASNLLVIPVGAGTQKVDLYASSNAGTITHFGTSRSMTVEER